MPRAATFSTTEARRERGLTTAQSLNAESQSRRVAENRADSPEDQARHAQPTTTQAQVAPGPVCRSWAGHADNWWLSEAMTLQGYPDRQLLPSRRLSSDMLANLSPSSYAFSTSQSGPNLREGEPSILSMSAARSSSVSATAPVRASTSTTIKTVPSKLR